MNVFVDVEESVVVGIGGGIGQPMQGLPPIRERIAVEAFGDVEGEEGFCLADVDQGE